MLGRLRKRLISDPGSQAGPAERALVRLIVPLAFIVAVAVAYGIADGTDRAPSVAFQNHLVFGGELLLLSFYALLLLTVPLVRGVFAGELPVELTTRGARYPEREVVEASLIANQELYERVESLARIVQEQEKKSVRDSAISSEAMDEAVRDISELRKIIARLNP
jgi:hypothetical protein